MNVSQYMPFFLTGFFPCLVILIGMWQNNKRFDLLDKQIGDKASNDKLDATNGKLDDLHSLVQHFIDLHIDHEGRIATLEERSGGKPKKP